MYEYNIFFEFGLCFIENLLKNLKGLRRDERAILKWIMKYVVRVQTGVIIRMSLLRGVTVYHVETNSDGHTVTRSQILMG